MKKIAYVSTARSELNASRYVIKAIDEDPEFDFYLIAGGKDWITLEVDYPVYPIGNYDAANPKKSCFSLSDILRETSEVLMDIKPDLLIIHGDRVELMQIVLAATIHSIKIAHIDGGQLSQGSIDNLTRYAISRFAHLHFVGDDQAVKNLIKTGEDPSRIFNVGQCGLENAVRTPKLSLEETSKAIGLDLSIPTALCIYYPSIEPGITLHRQIYNVLTALEQVKQQTIFIFPCQEIGSDVIIKAIEEHCRFNDNCKSFANLENQLFQSLMYYSAFMIGNSSCGFLEYPFAISRKTINVGTRQSGRKQYPSIINSGYDVAELVQHIKEALGPADGGMVLPENFSPSQKIVQIIKDNIDTPNLLYKKILL